LAHFGDLDLSERLQIARRGTAYFAQRLAELSDNDFGGGATMSLAASKTPGRHFPATRALVRLSRKLAAAQRHCRSEVGAAVVVLNEFRRCALNDSSFACSRWRARPWS
jgi:hypothetical protein